MGEKKHERVRWEFLAVLLSPLGIGARLWAVSQAPRVPEAPLPPLSNALLLTMGNDPLAVAEGNKLFLVSCVACHGAQGQGVVGPNLTDSAWLHGSSALQIHTSISKGFPDKGMVPFERPVSVSSAHLPGGAAQS